MLTRTSRDGRWTLAAVTLGSGIAILDGTVVNVALRTLGNDLGASLEALQWVVNGYMLALASLVLVGGGVSDRLGRRRVYLSGIALFAVASGLCGLAQSPGQLVGFRVLQGVGAAFATPGALAIIQSSFVPKDRAPAIGTWAGLSGVAAAIGPFLGGWILEHTTWRWIFWINVPLCVVVILVCLKFTPESRDTTDAGDFDVVGAVLSVLALAGMTYALTAAAGSGRALVWAVSAGTVVVVLAFVWWERRAAEPLVPLRLFADRVFTAANLMTFLVYGAMGAVFFVLALQLQVSVGYGPLGAGLATLPITLALMLLSSRAASLSARIGPRVPMSLGPLLCAAGVALLAAAGRGTAYVVGILPGVVLFALGLALLVSPLTATVLAAAPDRYAGTASGINNAVARAGSLLAVAALPAVVGLSGSQYDDAGLLTPAYREGMWICAAALAIGGLISWFGLSGVSPPSPNSGAEAAPSQGPPAGPAGQVGSVGSVGSD